jgi:1-aminocyclopropane-1-carboxylate deaminase/D-cysteine desulfhydrase-like pyridoxal-dependent ACC family enzyme
VVGVRITDYIACNERIVASIVNRAHRLLTKAGADLPPRKWRARDISMIHDFFGGEYAKITPEAVAAKSLAAETEKLVLDTTYTAKTMAAMIKYLETNNLRDKHILFWHTYNTRDLGRFLDQNASPQKMPAAFQCYFQ